MKNLYFLFFVFFTTQNICSQDNYPQVKNITTNQLILSASLEEKITTFYLKKINLAPLSKATYSVKGWLTSTSSKFKKPIVGVYDGNSLTLYFFKEEKQRDSILYFKNKGEPRERIQKAKEAKNFVSKIVFQRTHKGISGTYESNHIKKEIHLLSGDISVYKEQNILEINSKNAVDLLQLSKFYKNLKVEASNKKSILLTYIAPSTSYSYGRCAAGEEKGFLLLNFDKDNLLKNTKNVITESCLLDITTNKVKQETAFITHYFLTDYNNNTNKRVRVNLKTASITIQNL